MEENYRDFSVNRGIDLQYRLSMSSFLPLSALMHYNNRLILSILMGKDDIQDELGNGIVEKPPFLSPLVWVGLLMGGGDWEREKRLLRQILRSRIDCNYIGMCGFNLFHLYLVRSLLVGDCFHKLQWWVNMPMVDCNTHSLFLQDRPLLSILHPAELISKIATLYPKNKKHVEQTILFLLSRGMSYHPLAKEWVYLTELNPKDNYFLTERKSKHTARRRQSQLFQGQNCLPTPLMNDLVQIPYRQHLTYQSSCRGGMRFRFHCSYMDMIVKTHRLPFTQEPIPDHILEEWLRLLEKEWMPREEFTSPQYSLCQDTFMDKDKLFIHLLNNWMIPIYPYSRIVLLATFPLTERTFEYMCLKMRSGVFQLRPFHETKDATATWKQFFLWACYDCIHEFLFANQVEEIVSQLEIFYSLTIPFLQEYPNLETFLILNHHPVNQYRLYAREFDYTMSQVYGIFKRLSAFIKLPDRNKEKS